MYAFLTIKHRGPMQNFRLWTPNTIATATLQNGLFQFSLLSSLFPYVPFSEYFYFKRIFTMTNVRLYHR